MVKIKIYTVGKLKEPWLREGLDEYTKRLSQDAEIEWVIAKNDDALLALAPKEKGLICLDSRGKLMTSQKFSAFMENMLEKQGSRLSFLIGGPEGIPEEMASRLMRISLSPMTFTHQMVRLILLEQIYRAFEIGKNSPYHK